MTVIGLTGGIASGKSTAAEMLREFGATVIDADRLGHRSYEPGTPGFEKIVNAFGHDIVGKDGIVDRRVLGGKVFGAPEQMERLNSIVWPEIRNLIIEEVQQIRSQDKAAVIVLEAAVLLEAGWQDLADEIWVVTTPVKMAVERLRTRNGLSEDAAMARINSQMSNKERSDLADIKVDNAGTEAELRQRMEKAWTQLLGRLNRARPKGSPKVAPKPAAPRPTMKTSSRSSRPRPAAKAAPKATAKSDAKPAAKAAAKPKTGPRPAAAAAQTKPTARGTAKAAPAKATTKPAAASKTASKAPATSKATPKAGARKTAAATRTVAGKASTTKTATTKTPKASTARTSPASKPATRAGARTK